MEKIFDRNSTVKEAKNYKPFAEAVEHINRVKMKKTRWKKLPGEYRLHGIRMIWHMV